VRLSKYEVTIYDSDLNFISKYKIAPADNIGSGNYWESNSSGNYGTIRFDVN